jgi:hypothetical protein
MGVVCKVGIIDYSVTGECGGSKGSRGKGWGRGGGKVEEKKS